MTAAIRDWLEAQGLAQYAGAFEDNDIDFDLLQRVDDQLLKDIGVASAGHRLRLRVAIERLASEAAVSAARTPDPGSYSNSGQAERRQLTILFCDLVGSTELAQRLDPERLRELMQTYQQTCRSVIEKFEGHVAQYLGDGLMVYFGWPRAHEDDAERAVRAGLSIVEAISHLRTHESPPSSLQVRLGIATGAVVVGETGAGDASVPKLAVGETPNLASRLQGLAAPNQVIIGPTTHRLLGNAFVLDDLGAHTLKGIAYAVQAYAVTGMNTQAGRFDAARGHARLSPMVGREDELALIMRRWEQARAGEGHAELLCGEAGIGKSRILQAVLERIAQAPHRLLRYQCSTFHTHSTLYPFIAQMQSLFAREDTLEAKLDRLEGWLHEGTQSDALAAPLLASLLSLPNARYPALQLTPQRQKERTLALLCEQIMGLASQQPVLLLFEDAHWADPTSLELLDLILRRIDSHALMVLMTYRPEFSPAWVGQANATLLTLSRLSRREAEALVLRVTQGKRLPSEVMTQILAKTDGVPLFVEELTKAVLESRLLRETEDAYFLDGPLPPLAIPSTLQDSLMARLDRLAGTKEVAQIGACIGREFRIELLRQAAQLPRQALDTALRQLTDAEIVFRRGEAEHAVYSFKHALIQDAARDSLLKSQRVQIHQRIAQALEENFPEVSSAHPEVLAQHYGAGEQWEKAVTHWHRAGELALARVALREAIAHLDEGMVVLSQLAPSQSRDRRELALRGTLALAWNDYGGWAHPKIGEALQGTHALTESVGEVDENTFRVSVVMVVYELCTGRIRDSLQGAADLRRMARMISDQSMLLAADMHTGCMHYYLGENEAVLAHSASVNAIYTPELGNAASKLTGYDPKLHADVWSFLALWALGYPDRAVVVANDCVEFARNTGSPANRVHTLMHSGFLHQFRGEVALTEDRYRESDELARRHELAFVYETWIPFASIWIALQRVDPRIALERHLEGERMYRASGNLIGSPWAASGGALAAVKAGEPLTALNLTEAALEQINKPGWDERGHLAELLRTRALALAALAREDEAESVFHEAIEVARSQRAKSWELRAATDLAQFWSERGKRREAYEMLREIYDWFTEGFDTMDLVTAKALLQRLH